MSRVRLLVPLLALVALAVSGAAHAASPSVVISQVFAGGGNSGAPFANDYVELFDRGSTAVDLSGWSVQYAPATATTWQATPLSGTIQPGRSYLVQLASGTTGAPLPTPDASGTTNLAAAGGKVAVASTATPLTCGATAGSCSATSSVVDLLGYGPASDFEGAGSAPALSATTAALRAGGGCTDTDSNSVDFTTGTPSPRNSSAAASPCSGSTATGVTQDATVHVSLQSVLALALEKTSLDFGQVVPGTTPAPIGERVTVTSTAASGYTLSVHRSSFTPTDLPLGIAVGSAALTAIPVAPQADFQLAATTAPSAAGGDPWSTNVGFTGPIPSLPAGSYSATVTFTAVAR